MVDILAYKEKIEECSCLVIGDVMIDEYVNGNVTSVSPEAPVPIVHIRDVKSTLGGAANVAANIRKLGAKCTLVGVVGEDTDGQILREELQKRGVKWAGICTQSRITTKKTRIIGNLHQLVRLDREMNMEPGEAEQERLLNNVRKEIDSADIIIISDYKKGVCTSNICQTIISLAKKEDKKIIIDPKQTDWTRYSGAFLIKPNLKEFYQTIGNTDNDIVQGAKQLLNKFDISNILITRSQDGMTLVSDNCVDNCQTEAQEVFDVSGAGDTVVATVATAIAAGMELSDAIKIANIAAGISVSKLGTYAVGLNEIITSINHSYSKKIMSREEVISFAEMSKKHGKKVVFTNGCFDILHTGHISLLETAKRQGDVLIVGLNTDDSIKRLKGNDRPINNEYDRAKVLSALEAVDGVVLFNEDTPIELVNGIVPNVLVKGADYTIDKVVGADVVSRNGGEVVLVPLIQEKSTTNIIEKAKMKK